MAVRENSEAILRAGLKEDIIGSRKSRLRSMSGWTA